MREVKKIVGALLAFSMTIPGTAVMAAETEANEIQMTEGLTITENMTVDKDAAKNMLQSLGLREDITKTAENVIDVMNALSGKLVLADGGAQLDIDLNGTNIFSAAEDVTENGLSVASTLFPSYVVTLSPEMLMQLAAINTPDPDDAETMENIMGYASEKIQGYVDELMESFEMSVIPGEAQQADFTYDGHTFNTIIPVEVDAEAIAMAELNFVDQLANDEELRPIFDMASAFSGGKYDIDTLLAANSMLFSEEYIPQVTAAVYANIDKDGNQDDTVCIVSEATYKDKQDVSYSVTYLNEGLSGGSLKVELPHAQGNINVSYKMDDTGVNMRADLNTADQYFGASAQLLFDQNTTLEADLYFMDRNVPVFTEKLNITAGGERTMNAVNAEGKTTIDAEDILNGEGAEGFASDIMTNGITNLFSAAAGAMPQANELITGVMSMFGDTQGEGAQAQVQK